VLVPSLTLELRDRLMVLAPHPDDESVATGGLLARARRLGVPARVVYLTDGDNNPWAQRATERRLFIGKRDRERFGRLRREEAAAALAELGVTDAVFLGFPDQGLTRLLLTADPALPGALVSQVAEFEPTVLVTPSMLDRHPDHNALAAIAALHRQVLARPGSTCRHLRFLVHNPAHAEHHAEETALSLDGDERATKRAAIGRHRSQLFWRGTWLLSFAAAEELYLNAEPHVDLAGHPVRGIASRGSALTIEIASSSHLRAFGGRSLCLLASLPSQDPLRLAVPLPGGDGRARVVDACTGEACGEASVSVRRGHALVEIPEAILRGAAELLAKVEHRFGFFDEAGWKALVVPPAADRHQPPAV
jgi:LmbE family N-acetylglucosaminyl deacetylase